MVRSVEYKSWWPLSLQTSLWIVLTSAQWNHVLWAEQGYIVICPNISGSTGFGLEFARREFTCEL